tara:strand:- start:45626 stop:46639 length:1014 start_codon:yes stop_codon:yes gene_type:complete
MSKILITGGTGFVGTNLLPMLIENGHEVVLVDNLAQSVYVPEFHRAANFYLADIRDANMMNKIFEAEKPDMVFHFGGLVSIYDCHNDPVDAAENNIIGSINVFNAALNSGCDRVIFSETSAVYENVELPESGYQEGSSDPTTFYAASKASVALIADSYARTRGLKYTALRYFNIAGPIQDYKRTVPPLFAGVALRLLGGNNPIIFGDGTRRRDFIHVDDVNRFHLQCLTDERTIGETFNLGMNQSHSLYEISEIIWDYLKDETSLSNLEYDQLPEINGEAHTIFANIDKANELGWVPEKTIQDAIYDTIDYLKNEITEGNVNPEGFMADIDTDSVKI